MIVQTKVPGVEDLPVRAYSHYLLRVHDLISQAKGDSEEAEAIADEMDAPWHALSQQEQERMRGLSVDLYSMAEGGPKTTDMSPEERANYGSRWKKAYAERDWDTALALLRQAPSDVPPDAVAFLQSRLWEKFGDIEVALVFMRRAADLRPEHHLASLLNLLGRLGRREESLECARRIMTIPHSDPESVYLASATLLQATRGMDPAEAKTTQESMIPMLRRALEEALATPVHQRLVPQVDSYLFCLLGFLYELLGQDNQAREVYDQGLKCHPGDADISLQRGLLLHQKDPTAALADFERAARSGSLSVWPYFFLAWHALAKGQYHEAWQLSLAGLQVAEPYPAEVQAALHECLAIAQSELNQPADVVRYHFDQAIRLDPSNERIKKNRAVALGSAPKPWLPIEAQSASDRGITRAHSRLDFHIRTQQVQAQQQREQFVGEQFVPLNA
jgi:tetratricopeptide (TPR) repeat protein